MIMRLIKIGLLRWASRPFAYIPENVLKHKMRIFLIQWTNLALNVFVIRRGDTAVLVGAPPGGEYLGMSELVGRRGRVILVEPEKQNLKGLETEITDKGLKNVIIIPKAAYSARKMLEFVISDSPLDHKIQLEDIMHDNDLRQDAYISTETIETDTLDNMLISIGINHVDFVKIAVNGAELEVLKGMEQTLKRNTKLKIWVKGHALKEGRPLKQIDCVFLEGSRFYCPINWRGVIHLLVMTL